MGECREASLLRRRRCLHGSHYMSSYVFLGDGKVRDVPLGDFIVVQTSEGTLTQTMMSMMSSELTTHYVYCLSLTKMLLGM